MDFLSLGGLQILSSPLAMGLLLACFVDSGISGMLTRPEIAADRPGWPDVGYD